MSHTYNGVTEEDRANKGNTGKPDTPNVTTSEMQAIMDELANLAIDKLNELVADLNAHAGFAVESTQITNIRFDQNEFQFSTDNGVSWNNTGSIIEVSASPDDIHMEGYSKAEVAAAILITDTLNQAMGKLEKKVDDALAGGVVSHDFTITTTDWETNDNTRNNTTYTVKQEIDTTAFANTPTDAQLDCILLSATADSVMTEAEKEDAYKLSSDVTIGATSITVYAEEATTNALRIRVKGV